MRLVVFGCSFNILRLSVLNSSKVHGKEDFYGRFVFSGTFIRHYQQCLKVSVIAPLEMFYLSHYEC